MTTRRGADARRPLPIRLVCAGCGYVVPDDIAFIARCPTARVGDDIDHVLRRVIDPPRLAFPATGQDAEPGSGTFMRYRTLSRAYQLARAEGWSDAWYAELVGRLDAAIVAIDGHGFRETPFEPAAALAAQVGLASGSLLVKDETGNVAGSHKARHLMGVMLELLVAEELTPGSATGRLAIASCGNAALAAAVVARAAGRPLDVFVPTWADPVVVARLRELGADVVACPREPGETGDPTYQRLLEAIAVGAIPFTCQGNENGLAIEGGQTLGYEMVAQLVRQARAAGPTGASRPDAIARLDAVVVQVGGGALASAVAAAFAEARALGSLEREPRLYAVQTDGCAPLVRAWRLVRERAAKTNAEEALVHARTHRGAYMRAWESEPASVAHGILDDETYDWAAVVEAMERTGGGAIAVDEATLREANDVGRAWTGIDADHTGTAGLAGLLSLRRSGLVREGETVAVLFTGVRRDEGRVPPSVATAATSRPQEHIAR